MPVTAYHWLDTQEPNSQMPAATASASIPQGIILTEKREAWKQCMGGGQEVSRGWGGVATHSTEAGRVSSTCSAIHHLVRDRMPIRTHQRPAYGRCGITPQCSTLSVPISGGQGFQGQVEGTADVEEVLESIAPEVTRVVEAKGRVGTEGAVETGADMDTPMATGPDDTPTTSGLSQEILGCSIAMFLCYHLVTLFTIWNGKR